MAIVFKSDKAFNYLITNGYVYTLRKYIRTGIKTLKRHRHGKAVGKVSVEYVGTVDVSEGMYVVNIRGATVPLERFVKHSGFDSLEEWIKEFKRLCRSAVLGARLYRVTLLR